MHRKQNSQMRKTGLYGWSVARSKTTNYKLQVTPMVMVVSFEFARPFSLAKQPSVPEDYLNNDGNSITFIIIY